jgi:putative zinc finger/helix-turn-helix YgiT family protein
MECINCGRPASKVIENRVGRYRDETVEVKTEFFRCDACKEEYFSPAQMEAHTRTVKNEIRKKCGLLPPEKITEIRKKLGLTQEELEDLLGAGPKVVVRWESGKVIHGGGHDNMLRLLDRDPSLVESLRQIQQVRSNEQSNYKRTHKSPKGMVAQTVCG